MSRSYSELQHLLTFEERFAYLKLDGVVGRETFGFDRYVNQTFYTSREWKRVRDYVITRDLGCDLGIPGYEIFSGLLVHHMNPVSRDDILHGEDWIIDPNFLITTTQKTHNAIHYGAPGEFPRKLVTRRPGDTTLW